MLRGQVPLVVLGIGTPHLRPASGKAASGCAYALCEQAAGEPRSTQGHEATAGAAGRNAASDLSPSLRKTQPVVGGSHLQVMKMKPGQPCLHLSSQHKHFQKREKKV